MNLKCQEKRNRTGNRKIDCEKERFGTKKLDRLRWTATGAESKNPPQAHHRSISPIRPTLGYTLGYNKLTIGWR